MSLFSKPVLTKKRRKALDSFLSNAAKALNELKREARTQIVRDMFELMLENVARTPIYFYPSRVLRANYYRKGNRVGVSVTQGENVSYYRVIQIGGLRRVERKSYINLPAGHVFSGDKMTLDGILTLCHEYAHFPKPKLLEFAEKHAMDAGTAEELLADVLSAKLAVKMGFPKREVMAHFAGREIVYGAIPFRDFILRAIQ